MSFLVFDNLRWALVAVPVLLFYLWRFGGRRHDVSAYVLWQRAFSRRSLWSRWWQRWVSLAVALAFVGLLVLALTQPFWTAAVERARTVVLVLDTSASMNATDVEPSRLARAKAYARQIVDGLEPRERATVIAAGARIDIQCGFTQDPDRIRAALDAVRAGEGPTRIADAVVLARRLVAGHNNAEIIVVTDAAFAEAEKFAAADDVHLITVAGDFDNVGITGLAARSDGSDEHDVWIEVVNFGSQPVEGKLDLRFMGEAAEYSMVPPQETMAFDISGREGMTIEGMVTVASIAGGSAGLIVAKLDRDDDLLADNRVQLLVPPTVSRRVVVLAGTDSPVARALSGLEDVDVEFVENLPDDVDATTVTVFYGQIPGALPPGPSMVIEPDGSCDLWQLDEAGGDARRVAGGVTHVKNTPLLAGVDLSQVVFEEKVPLQVVGEFEPLVTDESELPLYLLLNRPDGAGPVLVFTARLAKSKSDLTMRRDFPLLLANAVRRLSGTNRSVFQPTTTSELVRVAPSAEERTLRSPDGQPVSLPAEQTTVGPLARGGVWSVTASAAPGANPAAGDADAKSGGKSAAPPDAAIAVSLVDEAESDIRPHVAAAAVPDDLLRGGPGNPLWVWLVVLAVLVCLVEWYLYHRRILV